MPDDMTLEVIAADLAEVLDRHGLTQFLDTIMDTIEEFLDRQEAEDEEDGDD